MVEGLRDGAIKDLVEEYVPHGSVEEQWDIPALQKILESDWQLSVPIVQHIESAKQADDTDVLAMITEAARLSYEGKIATVGVGSWQPFERSVLLQVIDNQWREHLAALDHLRQGIHLRGYAQKNPKQEYKRESIELFSSMLQRIRDDLVKIVLTVKVESPEQVALAEQEASASHLQNVSYVHESLDDQPEGGQVLAQELSSDDSQSTVRNFGPKVGRNDPCPCGSGKKYKQCHGRLS
jgi:preprotein translocase subunit SecA